MAVHYTRGRDRPPGAGGPGVGEADGLPLDIASRLRPPPKRGFSGGGYSIRIPGQAGAPPIQFSVGLPSVVKPPGGVDFQLDGTAAGLTAASGSVELASFQIPPGNVGAIRSLALLANGLLVSSDLRWTLLLDAVAVPGWNNLTINPRSAGSVELTYAPEETYIRAPEGALVSIRVRVLDAGTYQLSAAVHGWFFPSQLEQLAQAAYP